MAFPLEHVEVGFAVHHVFVGHGRHHRLVDEPEAFFLFALVVVFVGQVNEPIIVVRVLLRPLLEEREVRGSSLFVQRIVVEPYVVAHRRTAFAVVSVGAVPCEGFVHREPPIPMAGIVVAFVVPEHPRRGSVGVVRPGVFVPHAVLVAFAPSLAERLAPSGHEHFVEIGGYAEIGVLRDQLHVRVPRDVEPPWLDLRAADDDLVRVFPLPFEDPLPRPVGAPRVEDAQIVGLEHGVHPFVDVGELVFAYRVNGYFIIFHRVLPSLLGKLAYKGPSSPRAYPYKPTSDGLFWSILKEKSTPFALHRYTISTKSAEAYDFGCRNTLQILESRPGAVATKVSTAPMYRLTAFSRIFPFSDSGPSL